MACAVVRFTNVSKQFRLGETHDSLYELASSALKRLVSRKTAAPKRTKFWALRDVDFAVKSGCALGIIGPNGAGKARCCESSEGFSDPTEAVLRFAGDFRRSSKWGLASTAT